QTLAFVRLLLAAPRFVLLDRPGTVLQADAVARAVDLLASRSIAVVNFASDGERAAGYDARLDLAADGSWRWDKSRPAGGDA
ncbi:MAG TPA: ABC transporter ATP-binding protein/permease, partial [Myxococcota bacterium]|nr:ABC transporter ATP-binding protein/permease [Myxococcota bacterium]